MNILNRISIEKHNQHVAVVSLNRPEKFNALDFDMIKALVEVKKVVKKDRDIRVVILTGSGHSFCAGLDVSNFKAGAGKLLFNLMKFGRVDNIFQRCAKVWRDMPVPVIAVINGNCFGGGLQIAMAADFRFASKESRYSVMEAKWGLIPDMSALLTMPDVMRQDQFLELAMTAKIIDAQTASDFGMLTRLVDDPMAEALQFSEELLTVSPDAHAANKLLAHKTWRSNSPRATLFWETWYQLRLFLSAVNPKISIHNNTQGDENKKKKPFKNRFL